MTSLAICQYIIFLGHDVHMPQQAEHNRHSSKRESILDFLLPEDHRENRHRDDALDCPGCLLCVGATGILQSGIFSGTETPQTFDEGMPNEDPLHKVARVPECQDP